MAIKIGSFVGAAAENYVNEGIERGVAAVGKKTVESSNDLTKFVVGIGDEFWHAAGAAGEGVVEKLAESIDNPALRQIFQTAAGAFVGMGRAFAGAELKTELGKHLGAVTTILYPYSPELPGLYHRHDGWTSEGRPTSTCELWVMKESRWDTEHPESTRKEGKAGGTTTTKRTPFPSRALSGSQVVKERMSPCRCVGHVSSKVVPTSSSPADAYSDEEWGVLVEVMAMIDDPRERAIAEKWPTTPPQALKQALKKGLDAAGDPTEETKRYVLAAIDIAGEGKVTLGARVEVLAERTADMIERRDFSALTSWIWALFNSMGSLGLVLLFLLCLWGTAAIVGLWKYLEGWYQGDSKLWFHGLFWVFVASLLVPLGQKTLKRIIEAFRVVIGRPGIVNESFSLIGLKVVAFCGTFFVFGAGGIEMGFGPTWRAVLAGTAIFTTAAYFIGRSIYKDMSAAEYGLDDREVRQATLVRLARAMDRTSVLLGWLAILLPLGYIVVRSIDIPFIPLKAVEYSPAVEVQTAKGPVTVQYAVVTPNAFGLRTRHDIEEIFGTGTLDSKMAGPREDTLVVESSGLVPNLPGFILRTNYEEGDELTFSWKPGLIAQTFRSFGWDWYARHCYPEAEADGTTSSASSGGTQGSSGAKASANASGERTYLGLSVWPAAGLLVGIGVVLMIVAGLVRGQGGGREAVRGVGTFGFLLLVAAALGILGYEGVQSMRDDWREAHRAEQRVERPTSAPRPDRSTSSRPARTEVEEDAALPAPMARVRTAEECQKLSPVGRDICLANLRKAQANRRTN